MILIALIWDGVPSGSDNFKKVIKVPDIEDFIFGGFESIAIIWD